MSEEPTPSSILTTTGTWVDPLCLDPETVHSHPLMPTRCRMNVRRGDAPLRLLSWLRHLEQRVGCREKGDR